MWPVDNDFENVFLGVISVSVKGTSLFVTYLFSNFYFADLEKITHLIPHILPYIPYDV